MRYFLELRYNGAAYCGWQRQPDMPSVQQTLERALATLLREPVEVTGAGRTDTGVNASYYVAHFDCLSPVPDPAHTVYKLNFLLPGDIAVGSMTPVDGRRARAFRGARARIPLLHRAAQEPFYAGHDVAVLRAAGCRSGWIEAAAWLLRVRRFYVVRQAQFEQQDQYLPRHARRHGTSRRAGACSALRSVPTVSCATW